MTPTEIIVMLSVRHGLLCIIDKTVHQEVRLPRAAQRLQESWEEVAARAVREQAGIAIEPTAFAPSRIMYDKDSLTNLVFCSAYIRNPLEISNLNEKIRVVHHPVKTGCTYSNRLIESYLHGN